jgi:HPt (histidine-containing phosphotransfer) domain-containing protein
MHDHERPGAPIRSDFAGDPDMAELIEYFVSELPERAAAVNDCLRDNRWEDLRRLAHQLKGASGGYGFGPLGEAAAALEHDLDAQAELDAIRRDVDELLSLCGRITI